MNPEAEAHRRKVLRERAEVLARRDADEFAPGGELDLLEFRLGSERYALEMRHLRGVHLLGHLTPLPCTPPFLRGIVNLRGRMVPVLDLRRLLGLPEQGLGDLHRIVRVGDDTSDFGLLADIDTAVCRIRREALQAPPVHIGAGASKFILGVTVERLMVLDMARMLRDPDIVVNEQVDDVSA